MGELIAGVNFIGVIVGAVLAFLLGWVRWAAATAAIFLWHLVTWRSSSS